MALASTFALNAQATLTSVLDLATASVPMNKTYKSTLTTGTSAGQADLVFHDTRTIAASSNDDLDLAGVLTSPLGATLTFVKIKAIIVSAAAGNTNNVVVSGAATNGWTGILNSTGTAQVRPGSTFAVFAGEGDSTGYAVTAGTVDILRITNGGGTTTVTYDIIIVGTSA